MPYLVFEPNELHGGDTGSSKLQEIVCPKGSDGHCLRVVDTLFHEWVLLFHLLTVPYHRGSSSSEYRRVLEIDGMKEVALSMANLLTVPGESFNRENARRWRVDKGELAFSYAAAMVAQPFLLGSFDTTTVKSKGGYASDEKVNRVLIIGLGGGTIANFIEQLPVAVSQPFKSIYP